MKNTKIILSLIFLSFIFTGSVFASKSFDAISPKEFKEKMADKNNIVIDIRTPEEIALGKITKDALEINYYKSDFQDKLDELNRQKTYLIYCRSGHRSADTKERMKKLGFKSVYDLTGGINAWPEKLFGLPEKKDIVSEFLGKPTVILIAGTFCSHCQEEIPLIEKNIFNQSKTKINFLINVVDGGKFKTNIPQKTDQKINFETIVGEKCGYVPSWIVLDKKGVVIDSSCGNKKGAEGLKKAIEKTGIILKDQKKKDNDKKDKQRDYLFYGILIIGFLIGSYFTFRKKEI